MRGFEQRVAPVAHLVEARGEEPGEKENDDGLGDFRGLEGEAAETDPAMGVVRVAEEEDHDEKHGGDGEGGKDESGRVVAVVIDAGEDEHGGEAGERPEGLADEEAVGGVIALLATMAEAEKTMTRPTTTSSSVVKKIHLSTPTRLAKVCSHSGAKAPRSCMNFRHE